LIRVVPIRILLSSLPEIPANAGRRAGAFQPPKIDKINLDLIMIIKRFVIPPGSWHTFKLQVLVA
jgi:hypothetical protein